METFYKITGGKNKFEALPQIQLTQAPNEKIFVAIQKLKWDDLNHPIAITRILDGRNVIIIKGLTRFPQNQGFSNNAQNKGVLAFIEKTCPEDFPLSNLPIDSIMHAILFPFKGNTFGRWLYSSSNYSNGQNDNLYGHIYSSISGNMANELFAQLANKLPKNG